MPFVLKCQQCDTSFRVPDSAEGKWVKCTNCGHKFVAKDEIDFQSPPPLPSPKKAEVVVPDTETDRTWEVPPVSVPARIPRELLVRKRRPAWVIPMAITVIVIASALAGYSFRPAGGDQGPSKSVEDTKLVVAKQPERIQTVDPGITDKLESIYAGFTDAWTPNGKGAYTHGSGVSVVFGNEKEGRQSCRYNRQVVMWDTTDDEQTTMAVIAVILSGSQISEPHGKEMDRRLTAWLKADCPGTLSYANMTYTLGPSINGNTTLIILEED